MCGGSLAVAPVPRRVALLLAAAALSSAACEGGEVAARAIWVDVVREGDEGRRLDIYDSGERENARLGASFGTAPSIHLQLAPGGRHALVREPQLTSGFGTGRAALIDLEDGRTFYLEVPLPRIESDDPVRFASDGGALLWRLDGKLAVFPVAPGVEVSEAATGFHRPLTTTAGYEGWEATAADAPIVFVHDLESATLFALRYPQRAEDELDLVELQWTVDDGGLLAGASASASSECGQRLAECEAGRAVDPDGVAIVARVVANQKRWARWSREFPPRPVVELVLPEVLAGASGLALLAAIDAETLVFGDDTRVFRWDLDSDEVEVLPLIGSEGYSLLAIERGRGLLIVAGDGPITRIDGEGMRWINAERTSCPHTSPPVTSPAGGWIAWSCLAETGESVTDRGVVVRVSEGLGLQRYTGIVLRALAIDEDGDLLLQSEETVPLEAVDGVNAAQVPRALYTLDADEVLRRVDDLEPSPEPVIGPVAGLGTYVQARALEVRDE